MTKPDDDQRHDAHLEPEEGGRWAMACACGYRKGDMIYQVAQRQAQSHVQSAAFAKARRDRKRRADQAEFGVAW